MATVFLQEGSQYVPHTGRLTTRAVLSAAKRVGNGRYATIWWQTEDPEVYERMIREYAPAETIEPGETYRYVHGERLRLDLRGTGELRLHYWDRLISPFAVVKDGQDD